MAEIQQGYLRVAALDFTGSASVAAVEEACETLSRAVNKMDYDLRLLPKTYWEQLSAIVPTGR